jgi:hypothetical protein
MHLAEQDLSTKRFWADAVTRRFLPWSAAICGLIVSLLIWGSLRENQHAHLRQATELEGASIRNELVTAEVRGTLQKPEINMLTLPGTNRLISRVVGQTPSEQDVRLDQIQERAERGRGVQPTKRPDEPGRIAPR